MTTGQRQQRRWIHRTREVPNWVAVVGVILALLTIVPASWHSFRGFLILAWIWTLAWVAVS